MKETVRMYRCSSTLCIAFLFIAPAIYAFNLDLKTYKNFTNRNQSSYFGYSVGLRNSTKRDERIFVGAPLEKGPTLKHKGNVYVCNFTDETCKAIDDTPTSRTSGNVDEQIFGMSITSIEDYIVATSPRYIEKPFNDAYFLGRVSVFKDFPKKLFDQSPCEIRNSNEHYCMAGMSSSATLHNNKLSLFVGAPGSRRTQGKLYALIESESNTEAKVYRINTDRLSENGLMGYAISVGKISKSESGYITDVVGGAPRAADMQGRVIVYTMFTNGFKQAFTIDSPHDQVGSYFGAAVCVVDVNNDGFLSGYSYGGGLTRLAEMILSCVDIEKTSRQSWKDDLLIGSPRFSIIEDEGKAYIFMNRKDIAALEDAKEIVGENHLKAQFGSSITKLGDVNNDGFNDVAIGAPYGGLDGKGAVYIYNGGVSGLRLKHSQVIYSSDFANRPTGFGISSAGIIDVDDNLYPDLIVGAHESGEVFLLRSRPVIKLTSYLRTSRNAVPTNISSQIACKDNSGKEYNCIEIFIDLIYNGKSTPDKIDFQVTTKLDSKASKKRAFKFSDKSFEVKENVTLRKGVMKTINFTVAVLQAELGVSVVEPIAFEASYQEFIDESNCTNEPCPIRDLYSMYMDTHLISYVKACKKEETCETDLETVILPLKPQQIIYGQNYDIDIKATVKNLGEAAYQANMKLNFSADLNVDAVTTNGKKIRFDNPINLNALVKQLVFPLANPILTNDLVDVRVRFSVSKDRPSTPEYIFSMEPSAFGKDVNDTNTRASVTIKTKIETCVKVQADAKPSLIQYIENVPAPPPPSKNNSHNDSVKVDVIGSEVNYTFFVQNSGKLPVDELRVNVEVVAEKSSLDFMYVLYMEVDGARCDGTNNENDFNHLKYKSPYESYVEPNKKRNRRDATEVNCRSGNCKSFTCNIVKIDSNKGAVIKMYTRLWDHNLSKVGASSAVVEVNIEFVGSKKDSYIQKENCKMAQKVRLGLRQSSKQEEGKGIAWWIILLAIIGALILLAIVVVILHKVGFFKRKLKGKNITGPAEVNESSNPHFDDEDED